MNRQEILKELFEDIAAMRRLLFAMHGGKIHDNGKVTKAQCGVLFLLKQKEKLAVKEIAANFGMTSSAATQLTNGLFKDKLIARAHDPDDRRKVCIAMTAKGKKFLEKITKAHMESFARAFSALNDRELAQMMKLQKKMISRLK